MLRESKIVIGRPTVAGLAEHVFAYGDSDDAPRLVAILAARIRQLDPTSLAAKSAAECLDPKATWKARLNHLASSLHDAIRHPAAPTFVLWDADALAFDQPEAFDVERASLLRRDLFRVVRESAQQGGWILVRTARASGSALDDVDLARDIGVIQDEPTLPEQAQLFAMECQPLASWLVRSDVLRPRDLAEITRTVPNRDSHLVDLVYQELPGVVRDAAKLMSGLRPPQALNGHYGRVAFSADLASVTGRSVPASAREILKDCGLIQPTTQGAGWRMPRLVRERLYQLAEVTLETELEDLHRLEAEVGTRADVSVDDSVEAHHHAIRTGDIDLAKATAAYYGSELCDVARRLSVEAKDAEPSKRKKLFRRAADLYQYIISNYDPDDAYAWEYLGYNLALSDGSPDDILKAYRKAYSQRRHNALYHGRFIGFRGQQGEDIVAHAIAGIREYAQHDPTREPVSYFAKMVFDGLRRGGRGEQVRAIVARCGDVLRALAPKLHVDV